MKTNRFIILLAIAVTALALCTGQARALDGQLGILTPATLAGINPSTGENWAPGDSYRFAFITSATIGSPVGWTIDDFNTHVQGLADASTAYDIGADDGATWKVIGSTADMIVDEVEVPGVDAIDNTATTWTEEEPGDPIFLLDGSTVVANDFMDLWDGEIQNIIDITEQGVEYVYWPFTGTYWDGTKAPGHGASFGALGQDVGNIHQGYSGNTSQWIWRQWTGDPPATELPLYAMSDALYIPFCNPDLDGNGIVDGLDLQIVLSDYDPEDENGCDNEAPYGPEQLAVVLENYGWVDPGADGSAQVPEPTSMVLLFLGALGLMGLRRRT